MQRSKRSDYLIIGVLVLVFVVIFALVLGPGGRSSSISKGGRSQNLIAQLKLEGIILDNRDFLEQLKKAKENDRVKALVVEVNSPGGAVGPAQEIYQEIKNFAETERPVVFVSTGLLASGAYYAALGADEVWAAPGAVVGSIGVMMQFSNMRGLFDWARVEFFTITSGAYKDSGASFRSMRADEREYFQDLIDEVHDQFVQAVAGGRDMDLATAQAVADGRVFTGRQALEEKLIDALGTRQEAIRRAAELADLGEDYRVIEPPRPLPRIRDLLSAWGPQRDFEATLRKLLQTELSHRPLYLMPGNWIP